MAGQTKDALDFDLNEYRLQPYRNGSKSPHNLTPARELFGIAVRAYVGKLVMSNPKNDGACFIMGMNVFITIDTECMVKETYGHTLIPFLLWVW